MLQTAAFLLGLAGGKPVSGLVRIISSVGVVVIQEMKWTKLIELPIAENIILSSVVQSDQPLIVV